MIFKQEMWKFNYFKSWALFYINYIYCLLIEDASDAPSSTNVVKITLSETLSEMMLKRYMTNVEGTAELRDEKTILITFDNKEGK